MSIQIEEENFYPAVSEWLHRIVGCQFICKRKFLWGKQPDVLGVKFSKGKNLRADLYLVEVKSINCLNSAYNLIGEMETRIAQFLKRTSAFYALHPYLAIYESYKCKEIRDYAKHRGIGILLIKNNNDVKLSLEKTPIPIISGKTLSIENFKNESWIEDKDEARIFREAIRNIGWWMLKDLIS